MREARQTRGVAKTFTRFSPLLPTLPECMYYYHYYSMLASDEFLYFPLYDSKQILHIKQFYSRDQYLNSPNVQQIEAIAEG